MMLARLCSAVSLSIALPIPPADAAPRDRAVVREFRKANPCPSTGKTRGACPNWQVDHKTPLCAGGADTQENLQWLHVDQHRAKTRQDVRACRSLKPGERRESRSSLAS